MATNNNKKNNKPFVQQNDVIQDSRFSRAQNDPKFKLIKKKDSAIELDTRFSDVIKSGRFDDEAPVDQFGRKNPKYNKNQQKFNKEQFKSQPSKLKKNESAGATGKAPASDSRFSVPADWSKFDDEEKEEDDEEEEQVEKVVEKKKSTAVAAKDKKKEAAAAAPAKQPQKATSAAVAKPTKKVEESEDEEEDEEVDEEGDDGDVREITYGGFEYNSDTESSDEENDDDLLDEVDEDEVAQQEDIPRGVATKRLAILNCDWSNMQSKDLFIVLNSFVPKDGALLSVTIYPSEFGLQQMEIEKRMGPSKEIFRDSTKKNLDETDIQFDSKEDAESLDGNGFNLTSLRKYELDKLKYYYAVAVFDSAESASKVYDECDGLEIQDTANSMDLRFVPDEQEFTNTPKDSCTDLPEAPPNLNFSTTVLKGTSVDFTWDVDKNRKKALTKNFSGGNYDEDEIKIYLADPSSDDESEEEMNKNEKAKLRSQYRSLLLGNDDDDEEDAGKGEELKVTFKSGLDSDSEDDGLKVEFSDGEVESSGSEGGQEDEDSDDESDVDSDDESEDSDDNQIDPQDEEWTKQLMDKDSDDDETAQEITIKTDLHKVGQNLLKEKEKRESGTTWSDYLDKKKTKQNEKMKAKRLKAQEEEKKSKEDEKKGRKNKKPTEQELKSKAELELLMMDDVDKDKGYNKKMLEKQAKENISGKKKKSNKKELEGGDNFKINTKDSRFDKLYNQADYAMDPTDPKFKLTNAVKGILEEKKRRRDDREKNATFSKPSFNQPEEKQVEKKVKTEQSAFQQMAENIKKKAQIQKSKKLK